MCSPPTPTTLEHRLRLRQRKIDVGKQSFSSLFAPSPLDGWMAEWQMDLSRFELHNLKLLWCMFWITNTTSSSGNVAFFPWAKGGFFAVEKKHEQVEVDCESKECEWKYESLTNANTLRDLSRLLRNINGSARNNSDWWIISPLRFSFSLQLCWGYHFEKHYF